MDREITALLEDCAAGDEEAFHVVVERVYDELRRMARGRLAGGRPASLDTTGLVHEAYLKLVGGRQAAWNSRAHFFAVASLAMRSVIVDHARRLQSRKHGGDQQRVTVGPELAELDHQVEEVLAVHTALEWLEKLDARQVRIVEHRYFAGLTLQEAAEALEVSPRTAQRLWAQARTWLKRELGR